MAFRERAGAKWPTKRTGFDLMDRRARHVMVMAGDCGLEAGSELITADHLALALVAVSDPANGSFLAPLGTTLDEAADGLGLAPATGQGDDPTTARLHHDVQVIVASAVFTAALDGDEHVGAEHLLVSLLRSDTTTARELTEIGLDPSATPHELRPEGWSPPGQDEFRISARTRRRYFRKLRKGLDDMPSNIDPDGTPRPWRWVTMPDGRICIECDDAHGEATPERPAA